MSTCISRTSSTSEVKVLCPQDKDLLGIIDIFPCLQNLLESSPEIMSNFSNCDYAVYSTDFSEPEHPLVGHGMLSWIFLGSFSGITTTTQVSLKEQLKARNKGLQPLKEPSQIPSIRLAVGRVCSNILALFSGGGRETLEIRLKLVPINHFTQQNYIESINLYRSLSAFLPKNFDHPAWMNFVTQSNLMDRYFSKSKKHDMSPIHSNKINPCDIKTISTNGVTNNHTGNSNSNNTVAGAVAFTAGHNKRPLSQYTPSDIDDLSNRNNKKQRSESPFEHENFNYDPECQTRSSNIPRALQISTEPLTSPILTSSNPETDITSYTSSPTKDDSCSKRNFYLPQSAPDTTHCAWDDNPTSPAISIPSSKKDLGVSNRSLSTSAMSTSSNDKKNMESSLTVASPGSFRVIAQGRRTKMGEKSARSYPSYCENCGNLESCAWRRIKCTMNGVEREYRLCNPCGLWLQAKGTMRPKERWEKDKKNNEFNEIDTESDKKSMQEPPKSQKKRLKKPADSESDNYNGLPGELSIAEQLAINVSRNKQGNQFYKAHSDNSQMTLNHQTAVPSLEHSGGFHMKYDPLTKSNCGTRNISIFTQNDSGKSNTIIDSRTSLEHQARNSNSLNQQRKILDTECLIKSTADSSIDDKVKDKGIGQKIRELDVIIDSQEPKRAPGRPKCVKQFEQSSSISVPIIAASPGVSQTSYLTVNPPRAKRLYSKKSSDSKGAALKHKSSKKKHSNYSKEDLSSRLRDKTAISDVEEQNSNETDYLVPGKLNLLKSNLPTLQDVLDNNNAPMNINKELLGVGVSLKNQGGDAAPIAKPASCNNGMLNKIVSSPERPHPGWMAQFISSPGNKQYEKSHYEFLDILETETLNRHFPQSEPNPALDLNDFIFDELAMELGIDYTNLQHNVKHELLDNPLPEIIQQPEKFAQNPEKSIKEHNITFNQSQRANGRRIPQFLGNSTGEIISASHTSQSNLSTNPKPKLLEIRNNEARENESESNMYQGITLPSSPPRPYDMNQDYWSDSESPAC